MTDNIKRLANLVLIGFVVVSGFLLYWQVVKAGDLTSDITLNRTRLTDDAGWIQRGPIVDRNGVELASTENGNDGPIRAYSIPSLSHVVGYHSSRFGKSGVELAFDDYLRGAKGSDFSTLLESQVLHRRVVGNTLELTIDARLQKVADQALGSDNGSIVALNPRTGEILAMVSHPFFDPNALERDWERIRDHPGKPLFNRATQGLYAPGSTFKTVTLSAALEAGVTKPDELFIYDMKQNENAEFYHEELIQGYRIYDANHGPTEERRAVLDLAHAYADSCNIAFADLGLRLGARQLTEAAARFGIGTELPIEIASSVSVLGANGAIGKGDPALASTAFGQGELQVSPLQMALVASAVANGGTIPKPHLVAAVRNRSGIVWRADRQQWRTAMNPQTASIVTAMMVTSTEEGWAQTGRIPGVGVAAKTGTAETAPGQESHAWFIAFAPADNPTIAVAVIKEFAGGGATKSGPAAKRVIEAALGSD